MVIEQPESRDIDHRSSPRTKIALFRRLFRGREDVYARRFESRRTGKAGYQPACANEWAPGICGKPKIKCSDCPNQRFLSVTDETIRWRLSGHDDRGQDFVMGVYPMLIDETCFFLAADFDKDGWRDDAQAFMETCRALNVPAALERSRSGAGGHVWIFFEEAIPASLARKLGAHVLTETMEHRPDIGLNSYDRFFPNQDTLPKGGFGNLIALPLQKRPRGCGNSVFLDANLTPHPRLETIPATKGRFRLNAELPVPFDKRGRMEVDLLCAGGRIAVELDGAQHLEDADAYRRDRRKDQLLQENGYFVLRFLAEDVGKNLDMVLDAIQRTLFSRENRSRGSA